jgi:hypothetical protein
VRGQNAFVWGRKLRTKHAKPVERRRGFRRRFKMKADEIFDNPQRRAFIAYCKANLTEKNWRERDFKSEVETDSRFYRYYPPYGSHDSYIIQIDVADFKYDNCDNKIFALGFQYQNGTCKLNCLRPGKDNFSSHKSEIANFIPIFENKNNWYIYDKCNWPKSKAYISLSKREPSLIELTSDKFAEELFKEFKSAIDVIGKLRIEFEKIGCQFF